ncbi:hypothetical protein DL98DRAFT_519151 [Cadophora sp. DSE1049]|nr:hypothetical protein DL98DRAFT_519151 [Cadophora sp. DSE1049]
MRFVALHPDLYSRNKTSSPALPPPKHETIQRIETKRNVPLTQPNRPPPCSTPLFQTKPTSSQNLALNLVASAPAPSFAQTTDAGITRLRQDLNLRSLQSKKEGFWENSKSFFFRFCAVKEAGRTLIRKRSLRR